jgi:hypothetical protein
MRQLIRVGLLLMLLITAAAQRRFISVPRPAPSSPVTPPVTTTPPSTGFRPWGKSDGSRNLQSGQPSVVVMPFAAPYPVYVGDEEPPQEGDNPQQFASSPVLQPPQPAPVPLPPQTPLNAGLTPCGQAPNPSPPPPLAMMRPTPKDDPPSFYIALNDGWVYVARAYWVEKDTLHYITANGRHNQVSLALVNRDVSTRLNAKRADEFHLPPTE